MNDRYFGGQQINQPLFFTDFLLITPGDEL
jgi:hypothetical protein